MALLMLSSRRRGPRAPAAIRAASTRMKWFFSRASRKGTPLPIGVAEDDAGLRLGQDRAPRRRPRRTAARSLPSTRCTCQPKAAHLSASGSKPSTLVDGPSACWLLTSTRQIRLSRPVARPTSPPPRSSPRQLAVGHRVVDEGRRSLLLQAERHADGDRQALAERAAGHLHARRVGRHARHRQAAVVAAVGLELVLRNDAGLDQRRVERDRVVAVRQQEAVAPLPLRVVRPVVHARGSRRRPARRPSRAPGRCSPGPAPRPCAARSAGCDRRARPEHVGSVGRVPDRGSGRRALLQWAWLACALLSSVDQHTAIHVDDGAGDVGGEVGGEEQVELATSSASPSRSSGMPLRISALQSA